MIVGEFLGICFLNIANGLIKTLYLSNVRRQKLPKNFGLQLSNVQRRAVNQGQFVQGARLQLIAALDGSQAEKNQPADDQENRAQCSEGEEHLFANRPLFKFVHVPVESAAYPAARALCARESLAYKVWLGTQRLRQARHVE